MHPLGSKRSRHSLDKSNLAENGKAESFRTVATAKPLSQIPFEISNLRSEIAASQPTADNIVQTDQANALTLVVDDRQYIDL